MQVTSGTRLGPYEIGSRIGAGGMGEVWRAKDTRLDRTVAVKILPNELAQSAQLRLRFEREARTISQLNHPNICTLYDVGENYLVMELLEGETLAERLLRGPLPLMEVLRYGEQIAEALDKAHRAGIVHRDLKPGNIMITRTGAKLLDFGLARNELESAINPDGTTQQHPLTEEGTILGTFQYMAPEQLEGIRADARTDIFALGCGLYEMATGQRAFRGKTKTSLIAAIVSSTPEPMSQMQPLAPRGLDHVVAKCLEKDPDVRWQSAFDVAEELRWIAAELERGTTATKQRAKAPWALVAMLALLAIAGAALWLRERNRPDPPMAFQIVAPQGYHLWQASLSPDGTMVALAFSSATNAEENSIEIRRLDELEPRKLVSLKQAAIPFWSPDGKWIAYFEDGSMLRVLVSGGNPEVITRNVSYGTGAAWGEDGTILYCPHFGEGLFRVRATGGAPQRVTTLDPKRRESVHGWPHLLPDGKHFLFLVRTVSEEQNEIHIGTFEGQHWPLLRADALVGFARGSLLFVRDGSMYVQTLDVKGRKLEGEPNRIAGGVGYLEDSASAYTSISRNGAVTYFPVRPTRALAWWCDRTGRRLEQLFEEPSAHTFTLGPAGKVAFLKFDDKKGANDIYTIDLERGVRTRVTGTRASHSEPVWAPSGDRLYFGSDRERMYDIFSQVDDGTSPPEVVWRSEEDKGVDSISPDGKTMLAWHFTPKTRTDIWVVPLDGSGPPKPLIATEAVEDDAVFSPDGKWIAYTAQPGEREEVFVRPYPAGRSVQVSTGGGEGVEWTHTGNELIYRTAANELVAVTVDTSGPVARPGKPRTLFVLDRDIQGWSLSRTDDRILLRIVPERPPSLANYVAKNW